jgi:tRNA pseudouridine55 synthase
MRPFDFQKGEVLLINKPYHWTSFDAVNKIKGIIRQKLKETAVNPAEKTKIKVGHAGTLDPLATGLLIICTGKETKNIDSYQAQEKEYTGTFILGSTTPCFDLEKEIDFRFPFDHITELLVRETAQKFIGLQEQVPPIFSAVKIGGKRAYKLARAGKEAEIKARQITISEFEITRIALPEVCFRVVCSKGTYIRSLARDFGLALSSGAHLSALCRTRIGLYSLNDALTIQGFDELCKGESSGKDALLSLPDGIH